MIRLIPLGVALACFGLYVGLAVPGVYWLDSSEFAAAAWTLGIAHPPGHPLMQLWSRCFTLLPLGSIGFRVAIGQAAAAALAVGALCVLARDVLRKLGAAEAAATLLGAAAGIVFALSYGLAFHAVRPEVYALSAATTIGAAACALRGTRRGFAAAALLVGLGLSNHHLLALAGAAPILGLAIARRDLGARGWALLLAAGTLALGCYLYLPVRALRAPLVDWGHATTASQFWWLVSARAFQKAVHRAADVPLVFEAMRELGIGAAVCALGGLAALVRTPATRRIAAFLVAGIVFFTAASALAGFDAANPDSHGYLSGAMAFAAVLTVAFPAAILLTLRDRSPRVAAIAAGAVALACVLTQGVRGFGRYSLAGTYGADRVLTQALADSPPRALLTSNYFQTVFGLWYAQAIEGARPDVAVYHPKFATNAPPTDAARRPALYDLSPGNEKMRLTPVGLFYREGPPVPADFARQDALWDRLVVEANDPLTREFLLFEIFLGGQLRCDLGLRVEGESALRRAADLGADQTPELADLLARCR